MNGVEYLYGLLIAFAIVLVIWGFYRLRKYILRKKKLFKLMSDLILIQDKCEHNDIASIVIPDLNINIDTCMKCGHQKISERYKTL